MIRVCDAIMGTGKTSATITYLNEHKNEKFIYITPYLTEASRIKEGCPDLHFVEPSNKLKKYDFKKSLHTAALISQGRNIATTHQAFKGYTGEVLKDIQEKGYTLIVDENVDVLEKYDIHPGDLQMTIDAGYVSEHNSEYSITGKQYSGIAMREMFRLLQSRKLIRINDEKENDLFFWTLPPDLITSFKDVFILTYLFDGQSLHHLLTIYGLQYENIGIERTEQGEYRFGSYPGYVPEYVKNLKNMLHIVENDRLNAVGDQKYSLSINWFDRNDDGVEQLKRNVWNFFNCINKDIPANRRLWGTYASKYGVVKGKGYTKSFITFNTKATNEYKDRTHLVYIANIFMNVNEKSFYQMHGIEVNEDAYALSIMVQWIWRSAIRDGSEVYLYIPSKRMRDILTRWIEITSKGGEANDCQRLQ